MIKLRIAVAEIARIGAGNVKLRLQFATSSAFSDNGTFVAEEGGCTTASVWCYGNGAGVDNAIISTAVLSDPDVCVASSGNGCGTHNESGTSTSSFVHAASTTKEYEFTIQSYGASPNTVYFFRVFDTGAHLPVLVNTGAMYPSISTSGTSLSFNIRRYTFRCRGRREPIDAETERRS